MPSDREKLSIAGLTEVEIDTLSQWACPPYKTQVAIAKEQGVTRFAVCHRCRNANRKLRNAGLNPLHPPPRKGRIRPFDPGMVDQMTQSSSGAFCFQDLTRTTIDLSPVRFD